MLSCISSAKFVSFNPTKAWSISPQWDLSSAICHPSVTFQRFEMAKKGEGACFSQPPAL
jgi:hypothetical protein